LKETELLKGNPVQTQETLQSIVCNAEYGGEILKPQLSTPSAQQQGRNETTCTLQSINESKRKFQTRFQSYAACQRQGFDVEYLNLQPPSI
jgi:hypothetical protein